jgi:hypothetical protein
VKCQIPELKEPTAVDRKIIRKYGIDLSADQRARRKKRGLANVQYLRYEHFFVILATCGAHDFFRDEGLQVADVRKRPIRFAGYSISCRPARGTVEPLHASVRISCEAFRQFKKEFEGKSLNQSIDQLCHDLNSIPFEAYAPVRSQLCSLLRAINRRRKMAGLEPVPRGALCLHRGSVRPFETVGSPSRYLCLVEAGASASVPLK